jgi:ABC-type Zn2+ transport system substrate-binding protein/surface adhesin
VVDLARTYGRRPDEANAFAQIWAQLPSAKQQVLVRELRAAFREVMNAGAINTVHEPMSGTHSHPHHAYKSQGGDKNHSHEHTHDDDADHDHDHAQASAKTGRHIRFQHGQVQLLNSARRAGSDDPWDQLAESARQYYEGR